MRQHRIHGKTQFERPIYGRLKQFGLSFHSYKLSIILKVNDTPTRKKMEKDLIRELKTKALFGFNVL